MIGRVIDHIGAKSAFGAASKRVEDARRIHYSNVSEMGPSDPWAEDPDALKQSRQVLVEAEDALIVAQRELDRATASAVTPPVSLKPATLSDAAKQRDWRACMSWLHVPCATSREAMSLYTRCWGYQSCDRFSATLAPDYDALTADLIDYDANAQRRAA